MTENKNNKRALLVSVLSLMLCAALLVGFTFAWFTDSVNNNNRIVSGNLDIELLGKIDGEYTDLPGGSLFNEDMKWEPGQVYYWDLKIQNLGTLAAKFSVNISDWDGNLVLEANEDGTYSATERMLCDVIRVAAYDGTFDELVAAVNEEAGTSYTTEDREVVKKAVELDLMYHDVLIDTDPDNGALLDGTLEAGEETAFTLIAYWAFEDDDFFDEGLNDNNYNIINGLAASNFTYSDVEDFLDEDYDAFMSKEFTADDIDEDGLYMTFDIVVFATQTSSEMDGFGNDYDEDIEFTSSILPPEIGQY